MAAAGANRTIESLKVLTASLEIVSPQLQCFAETCVAKRAAEVAAFTKLGSSYTAYKGAYDSYDAKATAYNTRCRRQDRSEGGGDRRVHRVPPH